MRIIVSGTFDRLHPGHLFLLHEAQQRGELHVIVARDSNVKRIKGHAPRETEEMRKRAIEEIFPNAHVVLGDPDDFLKVVLAIHPDLILLGYDQLLPPGVREADLPCPTLRVAAFEPERYKSSLQGNR